MIHSLYLRARSAVAAAGADEGLAGLLDIARKDARRIEREKMPWGDALARLVRAGVESVGGDRQAALTLLDAAESDLLGADMALHATVARRRKGELLGGETGRSLVAAADDWMTGEGIQNPERMAAMLAPGAWS